MTRADQDRGNIHLLAGVYALHALPLDERAFYERHLTVCEPCRGEVAEYLETAARLGLACAEQPPPGLRARVLAAAERTRQISPLTDRIAPRRRPSLAAFAAALMAVVVGLSGVSAHLYGENRALESSIARSSADLPDILARADMVGLEAPDGVAARFVHSADQDRGILVVEGLAGLGAELDYQLWLFHDGMPVPAGVFDVVAGGAMMVEVDASVRGAEIVAVTVEPAGGVASPTGEIVLSSQL